MKTNTVVLSILLFCFATPFCMAKTTVLTSPFLLAQSGDGVGCGFLNGGDSTMEVTTTVHDWIGSTLGTQTLMVSGRQGSVVSVASTGNYYYCTFSFAGKSKTARGTLMIVDAGNKLYASAPAN